MKITVNGQERDVTGTSIASLLTELDVKSPEQVAVELNGGIIYRPYYETTVIREGDLVEFVYFMGGGHGTY